MENEPPEFEPPDGDPVTPTPKKRRRWIGYLLLILLLLSVALFRPALEWGVRTAAMDWFEKMGAESQLGAVEIHPWDAWAEIRNLSLKRNEQVTELQRLRVAWSWGELWQRHVRLRLIEAEKVRLPIGPLKDGQWQVAGFRATDFPATETPPAEAEKEPWLQGWILDQLRLNQLQIELVDGAKTPPLLIRQLNIGALSDLLPERETPVSVELAYDQARLSLDSRVRPLATDKTFEGQLRLAELNLARLPAMVLETLPVRLLGFLSLDHQLSATLTSSQQIEASLQGSSDLRQFQLSTGQQQKVAAATLHWQGLAKFDGTVKEGQWLTENRLKVTALSAETAEPPMTVTQKDFSLDGEVSGDLASTFKALLNAQGESVVVSGPQPVTVGRWQLNKAQWDGEGTVEAIQLTQVSLAEKGDAPPSVKQVDLDGLSIDWPQQISLDTLTLRGAEFEVRRLADGTVDLGLAATQPALEEESSAEKIPPPRVQIGRIQIVEDSRVAWQDQAVSPAVSLALNPLQASLEKIDTGDSEVKSPLSVKADLGDHATLDLQGAVAVGAQRPTFELDGNLTRFQLPHLSPYSRDAIGWNLNNGQLSAQWKGEAKQGVLDIDVTVELARLDIEKPAEQKDVIGGVTGMPLKSSLNMLKNSNGDIRLKVPVEGDMADPSFGWGDVTAKAIQAGVQQATVSVLAPLGFQLLTNVALPPGSLFLAGKLVEFVATVRFDPLVYAKGNVEPSDEVMKRLEKTVQVMKERPGLRLLLSGVAVEGELAPPPAKKADDTKKESAVTDEQNAQKMRDQLQQLAKQRADRVRDLLVERGIDPSRLFPALPKVDPDPSAQPRVELGA